MAVKIPLVLGADGNPQQLQSGDSLSGVSANSGFIANGRLTGTSGTPITTSDVTNITTVYYTPYNGNSITLWNGSSWQTITFTEVSLALGTITNGLPYDIFCYLSGGSLALEKLAWSSNTARATAVTRTDGVYTKSGDKTRLLLGSFWAISGSTTEDSAVNRRIYNVFNKVNKTLQKVNANTNWTYGSTTWRCSNNDANQRVSYMDGLGDAYVDMSVYTQMNATSSTAPMCGIGVNSQNSNSAMMNGVTGQATLSGTILVGMTYSFYGQTGSNNVYNLESTNNNTSSCAFASYSSGGLIGNILI